MEYVNEVTFLPQVEIKRSPNNTTSSAPVIQQQELIKITSGKIVGSTCCTLPWKRKPTKQSSFLKLDLFRKYQTQPNKELFDDHPTATSALEHTLPTNQT